MALVPFRKRNRRAWLLLFLAACLTVPPVAAQAAEAIGQCAVRRLAYACARDGQDGPICRTIAAGELHRAVLEVGRLTDPRQRLPLALALACAQVAQGETTTAAEVLKHAISAVAEDVGRTGNAAGLLPVVAEAAALQAALNDPEESGRSLEMLHELSDRYASTDARWLSLVTAVAAFAQAGRGDRADKLLDRATRLTQLLPDAPAQGPPRIAYLVQLVQTAVEAERWERASVLLDALQKEPPITASRYFDTRAVQAYRLLRQWLAKAVAARNVDIPMPTLEK